MMNNISNLHFGENAMKIGPKIGKLQMCDSHFDTNIQSKMHHVMLYTDSLLFGIEILFI